jgi:hypothetical protein
LDFLSMPSSCMLQKCSKFDTYVKIWLRYWCDSTKDLKLKPKFLKTKIDSLNKQSKSEFNNNHKQGLGGWDHHKVWGKGWVVPFERMFVCQLKPPGNSKSLANWPHELSHEGHVTFSEFSKSCSQPASPGTQTSFHKGKNHLSSQPLAWTWRDTLK